MTETLYLIDGHAQIYRAFYAVTGLTAPDGRPTGATMGFTRTMLNVLKTQKPDHIIAVFDAPGKTFRHDMYSEYKANRKPAPPELKEQVPLIQEIVKLFNIPVCTLEGYEADDLIGTLAVQGAEKGLNVVIVTGDKDCGQLLNSRIRIYDAQKDTFTTEESFTEKKGIPPEKLIDVMGLWGDSSDNIPGVPGIGEKIGVKLITDYGSLESLLDRADEVKGKRGEVLRENKEQALLSKELARIKTDCPVTLDPETSKVVEPDYPAIHKLFDELGFKALLRDLAKDNDAAAPEPEKRNYILVNDRDNFNHFMKALRHEKHFAFDTETTSLDPMLGDIVGMSFSWEAQSAFYLPFREPEGSELLGENELREVAEILEDDGYKKTGQNLKYDALILKRAGITLRGINFDSLIASNIINGHLNSHSIDDLAKRYFNVVKIETKSLIGSGKSQISMAEVSLERITEYACEDADIAYRLESELRQEIEKDADCSKLMREVELPLSFVLTEMQETGIRLDCSLLQKQSEELGGFLEALTSEIHQLAGKDFNIASPKQLGEILFDEMNMPVIKKTKTGASTDEATLTELAGLGYELPERILQYRTYSKLKNTYLDALPKMVNPYTGRVHTTFSQTVTATGRLSSRNPNLQNIPVRTDRGKAIRAAFIPEEGWKMLAADYSQVELRMLAHFSGDEVLTKAFEEGKDIHRVVAAQVHGILEEEVTTEQRYGAKAVNFGIIYGQSAHGLSRTTDMGMGEAKLFIESYFEQFPRVRKFIEETHAQAHSDGFVKTILGRRRIIPELGSSNKVKSARGEREALNTVIQGSAADLIKLAMINLNKRMKRETPKAKMLLQIHDELVFEAPPEEVDLLSEIVCEEMENAMDLSVPLMVDLGVGDNWLEVK